MENQHISSLFERIKARLGKQLIDRAEVVSILFDVARIRITEDDVIVKKGVLILKLSPLKRNELMLKKTAILEKIAVSTGVRIHDIR
jgi:hypothetical protein